jgi:hypothetical protein
MSALGQKWTFTHLRPMSALLPKADIAEGDWHVRFVPEADIRCRRARAVTYCATNATQIHKKKSC